MENPRMLIDRIADGETTLHLEGLMAPHCDPRVLHAPGECTTCDRPEVKFFHEERKDLDVNYTGKKDRAYPCPAERARTMDNINAWHGNRANDS